MKKYIVGAYLIFLSIASALATDLLINQPGPYKLGGSMSSAPTTANDNIIHITSSDVLLDLNGLIISQGNATANFNGIVINSGLSDIIIQNGIVRNVTGTAVLVNQGCARIQINNIACENCNLAGLALSGATGTNQIVDCSIANCRFLGCGSSINATSVVTFTQCSRLNILSNVIANTIGTVANLSAFTMNNCSLCTILNLNINNNTAAALSLFNETSGIQNTIQNTLISTNTSAGTIIGFNVNGSVFDMFINNSVTANNATGSLTGFNFSSTSTSNYLERCLVNTNTGVGGFNGFSFVSSSSNNAIVDCFAIGNFVNSNNNLFGFVINTANLGIIVGGGSLYNNNTSASATVGVNFQNPTIGLSWSTADVLCEQNNASATASSFGFNLSTLPGTGNSLFYRTIAFNNGTTAANQFAAPAGFAGSINSVASTNLNSVNGAWTNLAVAT
jgi:hypothetical protein